MAYSSGTSTDVVDLVNDFATFIEANGWTRDDLSNEGTGRRYHAHRGSQYLNMRAYLNETPSAEIDQAAAGCYGVAFNIGTGYSGATAWHKQAGAPPFSSLYLTAGISKATGAINSYHFFAHNSGDQIFAVVEYASGQYQYIGFGLMEKYGTFTGGDFMFGSTEGVRATFSGQCGAPFQAQLPSGSPTSPIAIGHESRGVIALATVTVDAESGWHTASAMDSGNSQRRIVNINSLPYLHEVLASPNSINGVAALHPMKLYVSRTASSGQHNLSGQNLAPLGEIPNFFPCSIASFTPAQQVTFGATNYRVFPTAAKGLTYVSYNDGSSTPANRTSGYFGFAIKE